MKGLSQGNHFVDVQGPNFANSVLTSLGYSAPDNLLTNGCDQSVTVLNSAL